MRPPNEPNSQLPTLLWREGGHLDLEIGFDGHGVEVEFSLLGIGVYL
jgi:hypothetical protein